MVLPDLGIGFLKACVDHFGPNAELIVQNIFENSPYESELSRPTLGWPPLDTKFSNKLFPKLGRSDWKRNKAGWFLNSLLMKRGKCLAAAELEYEDEYDDSFDDLPIKVANTALGIDEIEAGNANSVRRSGKTNVLFWMKKCITHTKRVQKKLQLEV